MVRHLSNPFFALSILALLLGGCGCGGKTRLHTVDSVDLNRYQGLWYEIARYPNRFEKGCVAATAQYTLQDDGTIRVVNRCRKGNLDGPPRSVTGKAWVVDPATNAKLKVRFFWPFRGDYWIVDLGDDYSHAVVGEPCRRYLWILARTPSIEETRYQAILQKIKVLEYDPERLERPPQMAQPELPAGSK